ncbi:NUDIX domain-containing protein [Paenibacillus pabuli]|uniref:NUDIX domain-containing protein n=1 Tax=Paenibacillus pabuli TaxID=1472 RepID=UPI003241BA0F
MVERKSIGYQEPGAIGAAFAILYSTDFQPYLSNTLLSDEERQRRVPLVFFINRYDGTLGFPGGKVEAGETIEQAVLREVSEEINVDLIATHLDALCSHRFTTSSGKVMNTHAFAYELETSALKRIAAYIGSSDNYLNEVFGCVLAPIYDFAPNRGFINFIGSPMASSVKEELAVFIQSFDLMSYEAMYYDYQVNGYNVAEMLQFR